MASISKHHSKQEGECNDGVGSYRTGDKRIKVTPHHIIKLYQEIHPNHLPKDPTIQSFRNGVSLRLFTIIACQVAVVVKIMC